MFRSDLALVVRSDDICGDEMNITEAFDYVVANSTADDSLPEIKELIGHEKFAVAMVTYAARIRANGNPLAMIAAMHALVQLGIKIGKEMSKDAKNYRN